MNPACIAMCGIVGFLDKQGQAEHGRLGRVLLSQLQALACRGPDSTGIATFGNGQGSRYVVRVKVEGHDAGEPKTRELAGLLDARGTVWDDYSTVGAYARFVVDRTCDLAQLTAAIEGLDPEIEVVSVGSRLEIVKQVGSPTNLEATYGISRTTGTHGIGHTRLSTESRVDLSHSQPFWSHGHPDVAIVHNGHITNYHQLRRQYAQRGVRFYTENDSEVVAVYLGEQLSRGRGLQAALEGMLRALDGSYSCVVATATELGFVKDPFALKPLLWAETDGFVAVANEEIAIRAAVPGAYTVREAQAQEVRVWAT